MEIIPGEPVGGLNARGVAKYSDFWHSEDYISQTVQDLSIGTKISDLNGEMVLILRYFTKFA